MLAHTTAQDSTRPSATLSYQEGHKGQARSGFVFTRDRMKGASQPDRAA